MTVLYSKYLEQRFKDHNSWSDDIVVDVLQIYSALHLNLDGDCQTRQFIENNINIITLCTYACTEILLKCKNVKTKYESLNCIESIFCLTNDESTIKEILFPIAPKVFVSVAMQFESGLSYKCDDLVLVSTTILLAHECSC